MLNRRSFLSVSAAMLALGARPARAGSAAERKFLFVLCPGGWDPSFVFAPQFDKPYVDCETDATTAIANGIPFVDHVNRPSVRSFFENWGHKSCVLNGFEVQSITHERCMRLILTGSGAGGGNDWGSLLAAHSRNDLLLPYLVLSGSSFATEHVTEVVRSGYTGQLSDLLTTDGSLLRSDQAVPLPGAASEAAVRAYLRGRAAAYGGAAGPGRSQRYAELFERALGQVDRLSELSDTLDFRPGASPALDLDAWNSMSLALGALKLGAARCAMVSYEGLWSMSWDSHSAIQVQTSHFEALFAHLNLLMETLEGETSASGSPLIDEVTVVVLSEMGRGPRLNTWGGKDHFTFTSAMLIGSGVR